jgi:3-oxoacyl-(acyl-carrier-protein) synthase
MSRRRVVVTGLGCISPVGNTVAEAWANLLAGKSGIAAITRFDASGLNCHIAGEVKNFEIDSYISPKEARSMEPQHPEPQALLHAASKFTRLCTSPRKVICTHGTHNGAPRILGKH